jgi:hypothetical protein
MYIKKRMRTRLILLAIVVLGFIYWRGIKAMGDRGLNCQYHIAYAVCTAKNNKAQLPSFLDVLKAGVKF